MLTSGLGDSRGSPISGVPPTDSSRLSKRVMLSAIRRLCRRAGSARDRWEHDDLVAVGELGLEAADEADVLVVDVDVDEATQVAIVDQALLDAGVVALEVVDQCRQRGAVGLDRLGAVGVGAKDGGDADLDGHQGVLTFLDNSVVGVIVTSSSVTTPSMIL